MAGDPGPQGLIYILDWFRALVLAARAAARARRRRNLHRGVLSWRRTALAIAQPLFHQLLGREVCGALRDAWPDEGRAHRGRRTRPLLQPALARALLVGTIRHEINNSRPGWGPNRIAHKSLSMCSQHLPLSTEKMLDLVKTGVVLWQVSFAPLKGDPVNALIHHVLMEVRAWPIRTLPELRRR